jgi:hypothetical protein
LAEDEGKKPIRAGVQFYKMFLWNLLFNWVPSWMILNTLKYIAPLIIGTLVFSIA